MKCSLPPQPSQLRVVLRLLQPSPAHLHQLLSGMATRLHTVLLQPRSQALQRLPCLWPSLAVLSTMQRQLLGQLPGPPISLWLLLVASSLVMQSHSCPANHHLMLLTVWRTGSRQLAPQHPLQQLLNLFMSI